MCGEQVGESPFASELCTRAPSATPLISLTHAAHKKMRIRDGLIRHLPLSLALSLFPPSFSLPLHPFLLFFLTLGALSSSSSLFFLFCSYHPHTPQNRSRHRRPPLRRPRSKMRSAVHGGGYARARACSCRRPPQLALASPRDVWPLLSFKRRARAITSPALQFFWFASESAAAAGRARVAPMLLARHRKCDY